jgi:PAS domain S-box-containing protein
LRKILHVDDSRDFREILQSRLLQLAKDICIVGVSTAEEALGRLKREKYHCVVSEYHLPGMSGPAFLRAIKKQRLQIPTIIMTGFEDRRFEEEAKAAGATDFMTKAGSDTDFIGLLNIIRRLPVSDGDKAAEAHEIVDSEALKEAILSIFQNSTVGFYRTTPSGKLVMANPALVRMLGYPSLEELAKIDLEGEGWGADYDRNEVKKQLAETGEIVGLEIRWVRRDGTTIYLRENSSVIRDEKGSVVYYQGTLEDITERKRAEEDLQAHTYFLQQLIDAIPIPIFFKDTELRYRTCNKAFAEMLGRSREETIGETVRSTTIDPARAAFFDAKDRELLAKPGSQVYEAQVRQADGSMRDAVFHKATFLDKQGRAAGIVGAVFDITDRKQAEVDLKRLVEQLGNQTHMLNATNKELESFAHTLSHDLQAPLRRINGWIEVLLGDFDTELPEKVKEYLERIDYNSREMRGLVDAILNFSRVMGAEITAMEVDLGAIALRLAEELQNDQPQRKVDFRLGEELHCEGDPLMLSLLLKNLLSNAWKYTGSTEDAVIEFGCNEHDGRKIFFVKDNGVGFDSLKADKLFIPFQRLHVGTEFEGSGIGLATAQRIVHRHGGRIWAEGEPGAGATFFFTLA